MDISRGLDTQKVRRANKLKVWLLPTTGAASASDGGEDFRPSGGEQQQFEVGDTAEHFSDSTIPNELLRRVAVPLANLLFIPCATASPQCQCVFHLGPSLVPSSPSHSNPSHLLPISLSSLFPSPSQPFSPKVPPNLLLCPSHYLHHHILLLPSCRFPPSPTPSFAQNHLESLPFPDGRSTLAFFPTGNNLDRVGFVLLTVTDSQICVKGDVSLSPKSFGHRILHLAACAAGSGFDGDDCVGFLMASTMYSVHWFKVSFAKCHSDLKKPVLVYIGSSVFKSSAVVHVCWNPHFPEESLVLLENGQFFLFDVNGSRLTGSVARFRGKRLPVSWDEHDELAKGGWLSCEFSWHPRIVVVANSNAVFLFDFRFDTCVVSCVLKVELLDPANAVEIGQFVSFSKAGSDGFFYAVASEFRLVLFDIRAPCKPMLQLLHSHHYPHYMNVFPLSELRGSLGNNEFHQASEMGFAIVLGSFWTTDFSLFCYGPSLASLKKSISLNKHVKVSNPFYAWDLPSELSLSGQDCPCSSCLIREELTKEYLPEWVDWQQKKQLVLGFFILDKDVSSLMSKADDDAGFVLIRLMSSGKLESQRYRACWDMPSKVEPAHQESPFDAKDFHLCSMDDEKYKFLRIFKYIRLEYLYAHMNGSKSKKLLLYKPSSIPDALLEADDDLGDSYTRNTTMIAKLSIDKPDSDTGSEGSKFFDDLCPIDLKFDDSSEWNVGLKEMHSYSILKKQFKEWQHNFRPYTDFCAQFKG